MALPDFSMRQLLEAGIHFGHQAHRWNPKMGQYIFGPRNTIHIVDLAQTVPLLHTALKAVSDTVAKGGRILFVGTKRQAQDPIADAAKRCAQYYVNSRWLGGTLTNWKTISGSIKRLRHLDEMLASGESAQQRARWTGAANAWAPFAVDAERGLGIARARGEREARHRQELHRLSGEAAGIGSAIGRLETGRVDDAGSGPHKVLCDKRRHPDAGSIHNLRFVAQRPLHHILRDRKVPALRIGLRIRRSGLACLASRPDFLRGGQRIPQGIARGVRAFCMPRPHKCRAWPAGGIGNKGCDFDRTARRSTLVR